MTTTLPKLLLETVRPSATLVYLYLQGRLATDNTINIQHVEIATALNLSKTTVAEAIDQLEAAGWLKTLEVPSVRTWRFKLIPATAKEDEELDQALKDL